MQRLKTTEKAMTEKIRGNGVFRIMTFGSVPFAPKAATIAGQMSPPSPEEVSRKP